MEDISRELEREIARSRPKPYKQDRTTKLLIVDDFGKMKSGDYYKTIVKFLSIISIISLAAAIIFYFLYSGLSRDSKFNKTKLDTAQKKVVELTAQKEVLMAKLVISGQKLEITQKPTPPPTPEVKKKKKKSVKVEKEATNLEVVKKDKEPEVEKIVKASTLPAVSAPVLPAPTKALPAKAIPAQETPIQIPATTAEVSLTPPSSDSVKPGRIVNKTVTIENFIVKKARSNRDLLVRFDIKKIAVTSGDVSGRIFTVLQPENVSEDQWLVVPTTPLKNGIPSEYSKGQYFSITHFKPVKFRIKNMAEPDFFKKAAIFIFNEQEELIFEKLINITEAQ
jgi:hypothetical protein